MTDLIDAADTKTVEDLADQERAAGFLIDKSGMLTERYKRYMRWLFPIALSAAGVRSLHEGFYWIAAALFAVVVVSLYLDIRRS